MDWGEKIEWMDKNYLRGLDPCTKRTLAADPQGRSDRKVARKEGKRLTRRHQNRAATPPCSGGLGEKDTLRREGGRKIVSGRKGNLVLSSGDLLNGAFEIVSPVTRGNGWVERRVRN